MIKKILVLFLITGIGIYSQETENDSIRSYRLGEIIKTASKGSQNVSPSTINSVQYHKIQQSDAASVSNLSLYLPAGRIQTNSRGETLLNLRGATERSLGIFFDGIYLNVPWDNRMDISLLPTDIIGKLTIHEGAASILYGANILGGAVNISTLERSGDGSGAVARMQYGDAGDKLFALTHDGRRDDLNYIVSMSYFDTKGFLLPEGADDLLNQNPNSNLRTNTDQSRVSVYARAEYEISDRSVIGISINHVDAEKGVAPEGHLLKKVRYWRYPQWKRTILTVNGEHLFDKKKDMAFRAAFWLDRVDQKIDYYDNINFGDISGAEVLDENTGGTRLSFQISPEKNHEIIFALNGFSTQVDFNSDEEGKSNYLQNTFSTGAEYHFDNEDLFLTAGATLDGNLTHAETLEGKTDDNILDYAAMLGARYYYSDGMSVFGNAMRRTRFPTLREKYSTGGGKFKVNKDLSSETGLLFELGTSWETPELKFNLSGFANLYDDMIAKANLPDDSLDRSTRVNLNKARILGAETSLRYVPFNQWNIEAHLTYLYAREFDDGSYSKELEYQPEILAALISNYRLNSGWTPQIEIEYIGSQQAENAVTDQWETINPTVVMNFRLSYKVEIFKGILNNFFVRINNAFDTYKLSQLGLPEPGRNIVVGLVTRM